MRAWGSGFGVWGSGFQRLKGFFNLGFTVRGLARVLISNSKLVMGRQVDPSMVPDRRTYEITNLLLFGGMLGHGCEDPTPIH